WRLIRQLLLLVIIWIISELVLSFVSPAAYTMFTNQIIEFIAMTGSIVLARGLLDKRPFKGLGLTLDWRALGDIAIGIGITFLMMGLIYLLEWSFGWITFESFAWQTEPARTVTLDLLVVFGIFVLVGWNEELFSRGYQLQNLADGINLPWGVIISSSVFGLLHLGNPNATWVSVAGIFLAGVFLAYGYVRTGRLWLSIGLHIGWNFFEGVVFGFPVSGMDIYRLTRINVNGPVLWTGGAFGPEAGLIVLPALILGTGLIYAWTQWSGRQMPKQSAGLPTTSAK
ncbi:MAG: CPBP family intramembrane metalloprotease, partial [Anaerolineales bacterium]|nr:CPBP family intramembrane metalloprotease [Anaerolineales bacterium]